MFLLYFCIWVLLFLEYVSTSKIGDQSLYKLLILTDNVTFRRLLEFAFLPVIVENASFLTFLSSADIISYFVLLLIWQVKMMYQFKKYS